ncbi:auxilin-related protein 2-like [Vigna umbellata]|uniref:auxilin-related protein 2-like n=1 Tax=Vigna umbellata TaxID=87088 RepID=UPI001F5F6B26|nr:auxilin-related protein 2-like [Vigna umbellata]
MNDFDGLLTSDFGFKPQGKSAPMAAPKASSNNSSSLNFDLGSRSARASNSLAGHDSVNAASFDDLFSGGGKSDASYDFDSVFRGSADFRSKSVNLPAHDKPVYDKPMHDDDDDIFDGVPGLKSSSKFSYGDVLTPAAFDDLLGGLGKSKPSEKKERGVADFDDLIPGFGSSKVSTDGYVTCL